MKKNKKHKPFTPGDRIGRLTLIDTRKGIDARGKHRRWWNVLCDCGERREMLDQSLKSNRVVSCGCYQVEIFTAMAKNPKPRRPRPNRLERFMLSQYKSSAKQRGYSFELGLTDIQVLIYSNCVYCGCDPQPHPANKFVNRYDDPSQATQHYNGVDRVNNTLGYTASNCVTCCGRCNEMKNSMGLDTFKQHVKQIYEHLQLAAFVGKAEQYARPAIR